MTRLDSENNQPGPVGEVTNSFCEVSTGSQAQNRVSNLVSVRLKLISLSLTWKARQLSTKVRLETYTG